MIPGFDPEFDDLEHYILVITERIWEGRRIDDIHSYYSADCVVETPLGISTGVAPVIEGTRATLVEFPDRELLAEDVLVSGDPLEGMLSSHRIFSPMTHSGTGRFGPATGRGVQARTIADCVCRDNRIVHEWLVRDHGAIARQLGWSLPDLARHWLKQQPGWTPPNPTVAPSPYQPSRSAHALARTTEAHIRACWTQEADTWTPDCDRALASALPGGEIATGLHALARHWDSWRKALALRELTVEHIAVHERPNRPPMVSLRWRAHVRHNGAGQFGEPTGRDLTVLAIQHMEWLDGRIRHQWLLIDELAIWMQLLRPQPL